MAKKFKIKVVDKPGGVKSREYPLHQTSIIGYKKPRDMSIDDFNDFIERASNDVLARYGISTIVVGVKNWNELRILDEETMQRNGWVREERVFLYKDEIDMSQFSPMELKELMEEYVIPKEILDNEEE